MERLQRFLARAGIASRRKSEELILQGKVKVNGKMITELGKKVDPRKDRIHVDGKLIENKEQFLYILLNKPKGYISTAKDTHNRKIVLDLLPKNIPRIYPVGRLDTQTSGLLLLTNDGQLTYTLTHPKYEFPKTYHAWVSGVIRQEVISELQKGILLVDGLTAPAKVNVIKITNGKSLIEITLHEGRNRQVRRMFETVGYPVIDLKRVAFGFLNLKGVEIGKYRGLSLKEINKLKSIK